MESVAVTSGTFFGGEEVHVPAPSTAISSLSGVHICLNNVRISNTWEHQKTYFVQGHSGNHSCNMDEIFVFHLLEVHAKFCFDPSCKCRCRCSRHGNGAEGTEMTHLVESNIFFDHTQEPKSASCCKDMNDVPPIPCKKPPISMVRTITNLKSSSSPGSAWPLVSEAQSQILPHQSISVQLTRTEILPTSEESRDVGIPGLKIELPDPLSHDEVGACNKESCTPSSEESRNIDIAVVKMEPPDSLSHDQMAAPDKESCNHSSMESRDVNTDVVKMEPPDPLSHDLLDPPSHDLDPLSHDQAYCSTLLEIKQEDVDDGVRGPSEVECGLNALSKGVQGAEIDSMLEAAMESPDVSQYQQKVEENRDEHEDKNSSWLNSEDLLAARAVMSEYTKMKGSQIVLHKRNIRQMPARCEDCHKALPGSRFQYSVDGAEQNSIRKCKRCREDEVTEPLGHAMDKGADALKEKACHPTCPGTAHQVMSEDTGYLDHQVGENITPAAKTISSSNQGEVTDKQVLPEGVTDTNSSEIQSRIHTNGLIEDYVEQKHSGGDIDGVTPMKCNSSSKTCMLKHHVQKHKCEHSPLNQTPCSSRLAHGHIDSHMGESSFSHVCSETFSKKSNLIKQTSSHSSENDSVSSVSLKAFTFRTHTDKKPFSCEICKRSFSQKCHLISHMGTHTGDRPHICIICKKTFSSILTLRKHIRTHTDKGPFSCDVCKKSFAKKIHLTDHIWTHTDEKLFSYDVCKGSVSQKSHMIGHVRAHTGEKPFSCDVCKKSFSQRSHMIDHMRTHTGERPFSCDICKKSFSQKSHITGHMRTHTGEKPFSCDVCKKSFSRRSHLISHMGTHTGDKPHICTICKKAYSRSSHLRRHFRTHAIKGHKKMSHDWSYEDTDWC